MKSKVYDIITEALKKAQVKFDTDGESIWVQPPQGADGRTVTINMVEWDADESIPQQQDATTADGQHRFTVSISATLGTVVEVTAPDEETAEGIVNVKWMNDEIKLDELTLHDTRIDCTGRLD